ncbi:MAG: phasin family protein [Pseudoxanthomonas sp.]
MSAQFSTPFSGFAHQFTAVAARANRLALENAEAVFGLQLKTFEKTLDATTGFIDEAVEVRDFDGYRTLFPKGVQVARENAERLAAVAQELVGLSIKTGEEFGKLAKAQFESATETVTKATKAATGKK